ncbi:MAG TPA: arsinothricin resistance N-acetyltransferase ArsN1 family B [Longimicrobiales bacterium]|nr:arsinothricin resistance N-acetyltransferase ArsN1 family B [Longimicrobiales bacterium]
MSCVIRLASDADAPAVAAIYAPAVTASAASFELEPPDADEMARRMAETQRRTPWLVCERDGRVAGYAYAGRHRDRPAYRWSVEVSAYVSPDARRTGLGRALYTSLFAVLRLQGFRSAFAGITLPNHPSQALHRAVGFERVGVFPRIGYKHGAWHDVEWLCLALLPHVAEPPEPVALPDVSDARALSRALSSGAAPAGPVHP